MNDIRSHPCLGDSLRPDTELQFIICKARRLTLIKSIEEYFLQT